MLAKSWYYKNLDKNREKMRNRNRAQAIFLKWLKSSVPCMDCGQVFHPVCMDFDHKPDAEKCDTIASMSGWSLARLQEEIMKCELVCSNCHRLRTYSRRQYNSCKTV